MEQKLCIDCGYCHKELGPIRSNILYFCTHDKAIVETNMVNGQKSYRSCKQMREDETACGKEGHFFKPKKSLIIFKIIGNFIRGRK